MFAAQRRAFPNLRVIEWERPRARESVRQYAARLARRIPPGPFVIGGVSFGGLIAQEIAAIRRPQALVLIASLRSSREIFAPLRLGKYAPQFGFELATWFSQRFGGLAAPLYGSRGGHTRLLAKMLADADPRFLTWARRAVLDWEAPELRDIPTLRIHGTRDMLITPLERAGTTFIRSAGHTVNMTHDARVNRVVGEYLARLAPG